MLSPLAGLTLLAALAASCARKGTAPIVVAPEAEFVLAPGQVASLAAPAVGRARFLQVVDDGRCPSGTECAASMPVTVEVELDGGGPTRLGIFSRGAPDLGSTPSCARFGDMALRLVDVQPWPVRRESISAGDYRATLVFRRSCDAAREGHRP